MKVWSLVAWLLVLILEMYKHWGKDTHMKDKFEASGGKQIYKRGSFFDSQKGGESRRMTDYTWVAWAKHAPSGCGAMKMQAQVHMAEEEPIAIIAWYILFFQI